MATATARSFGVCEDNQRSCGELRTPLNAIIGFSEVLREEMFGPVNEKQAEYLDDIVSSGNHLLSLINDVLDLSKVEAGQVELERRLFSLREALERGVVMVRERAMKNGVDLSLELDPHVDLVEGDERRIRQVVFNLLSNAVKFTPSGGRVEVSTAKENGEVRIAVRDTGPGVPPHHTPHLFTPFFTTKGPGQGTGLGLSLIYGLVQSHGGVLSYEPPPEGGAEFRVVLPFHNAPAEALDLEAPPMRRGSHRVLVVDSDLGIHRLVNALRDRAAQGLGDAERWQEYVEDYPGKRIATPEEVAHLATFLVSPRSAYTSGTVVTLDGGMAWRGRAL